MSKLQDVVEVANERNFDTVLSGETALSMNGLVSGYDHFILNTPDKPMDYVSLGPVMFQYYHINSDKYLSKICDKVFLPTPERAIIDTMIWYKENGTEGFLIEALQTYQEQGHKIEDLYECADHYLVPHEVVNYWWQEALEDSEMSMG